MKSLDDFHEWFRKEAYLLPEQTKGAAYKALETKNPRQIFVELDELRKAGKLPASWGGVLDLYYSKFF